MKLGFQFVPFPREIWTDNIQLSQSEFRLLGWLLCDLKFGVQRYSFTDDELLTSKHNGPPLNLARNSLKKARQGLQDKGFLTAERSLDTWTYTLSVTPQVSRVDTQVSRVDTKEPPKCQKLTPINIKEERKTRYYPPSSDEQLVLTSDDGELLSPKEVFNQCRESVFKCIQYLTQEKPVWDGSDAKQLKSLLSSKPDITPEKFHQWLVWYAMSEINPADRPRVFLPKITSYAMGPLDRYGKPLITKKRSVF